MGNHYQKNQAMKIIINIEETPKEHFNKGRAPINKGKKLWELYPPEKVKQIRKNIIKSQLERYERVRRTKVDSGI